MLSIASLPARVGSKISVFRFSIVSSARTPEALGLTGGPNSSQHRLNRALSPAPRWFSVGHNVRFVSLSASFRENVDSSSDNPEWENFGFLSKDMASRRLFKKSSPGIRDLPHGEYADDEEVEEVDKTSRRPSRTNTPYWYFLQCKKLIRENKVRQCPVSPPSFSSFSVYLNVLLFI